MFDTTSNEVLKDKNERIFKRINIKLNSDDEESFIYAADKLRTFVSRREAYYPEARPHIVGCCITARTTLTRLVNPDSTFRLSDAFPVNLEGRAAAYARLIRTVLGHSSAFEKDGLLRDSLNALRSSVDVEPSLSIFSEQTGVSGRGIFLMEESLCPKDTLSDEEISPRSFLSLEESPRQRYRELKEEISVETYPVPSSPALSLEVDRVNVIQAPSSTELLPGSLLGAGSRTMTVEAVVERISPESDQSMAEIAHEVVHAKSDSSLSIILSKLKHLDLSGCVLDKDVVMEAHGGYCDVFVGHMRSESLKDRILISDSNKDDEVRVAIKRLRVRLIKDKSFAKSLAREMSIWSKLNHPNVLPLLGYSLEKDYPSLISPWMEFGTIKTFLRNQHHCDLIFLALRVAEGLQYIHQLNIVHSDMKADNVLISPSGEPLICDFGISRMLDSTQTAFVSTTHDGSTKGSTRWMAPELLYLADGVELKHSKESDVWAYGMTLYEMISKELPYTHLRQDAQVLLAIINGELPSLPTSTGRDTHQPSEAGLTLRSICDGCWNGKPKGRLTMSQITSMLSS